MSPMFSPRVSWPFTFRPGQRLERVVLRDEARPRALNASPSALVHQSSQLAVASDWRPWSSKPWPISWPMTAPMAP